LSAVAAERRVGARLLHRKPVLARDGRAGELADILFNDASWTVRYFVVDDMGPMPRRDVLVAPALAVFTTEGVRVHLTREELKHCSRLEEDPPVYLQHDMHARARAADRHLRSAEILLGFTVRSRGQRIGRLRDLKLGGERWAIETLSVDTGVFLPGKRRAVLPNEVAAIDWIGRTIDLR
jgi:sporulation protein YlmC with PRC-barrel domain